MGLSGKVHEAWLARNSALSIVMKNRTLMYTVFMCTNNAAIPPVILEDPVYSMKTLGQEKEAVCLYPE